jgi:hypothetical protein
MLKHFYFTITFFFLIYTAFSLRKSFNFYSRCTLKLRVSSEKIFFFIIIIFSLKCKFFFVFKNNNNKKFKLIKTLTHCGLWETFNQLPFNVKVSLGSSVKKFIEKNKNRHKREEKKKYTKSIEGKLKSSLGWNKKERKKKKSFKMWAAGRQWQYMKYVK